MRERFYTAEVDETLADLGVSDVIIDLIDDQVALLAENPHLGYRIPILLLEWPRGLYRYEVGSYKLNYVFDDRELTVLSITA